MLLPYDTTQPDVSVQENSVSEGSIFSLPPPLQLLHDSNPHCSHPISNPKQLLSSASVTQQGPVGSSSLIPKPRLFPSICPSSPPPSLPPGPPLPEISNSQEVTFICSPSLADSIASLPPPLNSPSQDLNLTVSSYKVRFNNCSSCCMVVIMVLCSA